MRPDNVHESADAGEEARERKPVADLAHDFYSGRQHWLVHLGKYSLLPKLQHVYRIDR